MCICCCFPLIYTGNNYSRSDCIDILSECVDDSSQTYNISSLCDMLSVSDDNDQCISLLPFHGECE